MYKCIFLFILILLDISANDERLFQCAVMLDKRMNGYVFKVNACVPFDLMIVAKVG